MLNAQEIEQLAGIVGSDALVVAAQDKRSYETAARYGGGSASVVVRPLDKNQVSALLKYCTVNRLQYVPQSGNTGLVLGSTPDSSGREIVISLERLRDLQIDVADRTATVGAGVRLSALNGALDPHGLCLPIDVSSDPMVGGMVATNTGGARFLRYGDMRRHVLGLEVVLPDEQGTVLQLSGGLRKDNAHLDLRQLFIGSCGAFGIVTAATVEVHPQRRQVATALLIPRDDSAIMELLMAFESACGEYLSAFEGMSKAVLQHAFHYIPTLPNLFPDTVPDYVILVELASVAGERPGEPNMQSVLESTVMKIAEQDSSPIADARLGRSEDFWSVRHALSEGLRKHGPVLGLDLSFRRSHVIPFRRAAIDLVAATFPDFEVCDFGHIADGGLHFNLVSRTPQRTEDLRDALLELAIGKYGASFSGEHGIGRANQHAYDRYIPEDIQRYSAQVAAVFARLPSAAVRFGPHPATIASGSP